MTVPLLSLFPARVRFTDPNGVLTSEAYRSLQRLFDRVGGALGEFDFSSLAISGNATIGGTLSLSAGSAVAPSLFWTTDTDTGFYQISPDRVGYTSNGTLILNLGPTGINVTGTTTSTSFSGAGSGLTGTASGLTAGNVTTNANLTGPITSVGNATAVASQTGTGSTFVMNTNPTLITPALGNATATSLQSPIGTITPNTGAFSTLSTSSTATIGSRTTAQTFEATNPNVHLFPTVSARFNTSNFRIGFGINNSNGDPYIGFNANPKLSSDVATYDLSSFATQIRMNDGQIRLNVAPLGTAGNDITFSTIAAVSSTGLNVTGTTTSTSFTGAGTGLTGTASGLTAGSTSTNANLTGPITSVGNATSVASQTGTGTTFVMNTSPTLVTPALGNATATSLQAPIGTVTRNTANFTSVSANLHIEAIDTNVLTRPAVAARFNDVNNRIGFNIAHSNGFGYLSLNANPKIGSDTATYDITQAAAQLRMDNDAYIFNLGPSGTAGTDITWTTSAHISRTGGLTLGSASGVSGSSAGEIGIPNAASIRARNGANSGWLSMISVNASDQLVLGGLGATGDTIFSNSGIGETMRLTSGTLLIGRSSSSGMGGRLQMVSTTQDSVDIAGTDVSGTTVRIRNSNAAGAITLYQNSTTSTLGSDGLAVGIDGSGNAVISQQENLPLFITANGAQRLTINPDGNILIATVGGGLRVKEGSNAKQGTATLVAGVAVVANTSVTANSRIFLTSQADGGTPGFLRVSTRVASTSFTITSSSVTDTSTVAYEIFEPA